MTKTTANTDSAHVIQSESPSDPWRWVMLAGVWLLYFAFGLTAASMAPLVNELMHDFQMSHSRMGSVLAAWPLFYIGAAIPAGAMIDRFGLRRCLLAAALVIALSAYLRAVATTPLQLFLAVGVFGLGGPLISIGAPKLISQWFQGAQRGLAIGIYMTGPALGGITSLALTYSVLMPIFANDWRQVLLVYAAMVVVAALVWFAVTLSPRSARPAGSQPEQAPSESAYQVFKRLLAMPYVQLVLVLSIGIFMFNHGLGNWLPAILRAQGVDAVQAGYLAAVPTLIGVFGSLVIPRLAVPARRMMILSILLMFAAAAAVFLTAQPGLLMYLALFCQGVARSALMPIAILLLIEAPQLDRRHVGMAGGLFFTAAEVGGVMGPVVIGSVKDLTGAFDASLYLLALISLTMLALLVPIRRLTTPSTP